MTAQSPKIFVVGLQKTGLSSLYQAFSLLGKEVCGNRHDLFLAAARKQSGPLDRLVQRHDAFVDNPWAFLYKELDEWYPGSKFILSHRERESWYRSVCHHIGVIRTPMHEWIYGWGKGIPSEDKDHTLRVFDAHIAAVQAYFRDKPDRFLEVNIASGDGWEKLCGFLGEKIPDAPFPHANKSDYSKKDREAALEKPAKFARKKFKHQLMLGWAGLQGLKRDSYARQLLGKFD